MTMMNQKKSNRRGHSMMEMMVVMSVLAGMATLSWPMLQSPLSKLRLQSAAQEVTTELAKARLKAMQSGVAQVFRIQLNTGKFQVMAASDEESDDDSSLDSMEVAETSSGSDLERSPLTEASDKMPEKRELPCGICFTPPKSDESTDSRKSEEVEDEQGWTDLAVFYPNGDTTNAVVGLRSNSDMHVDVKLNGLTGIAKIGEAHRQEYR